MWKDNWEVMMDDDDVIRDNISQLIDENTTMSCLFKEEKVLEGK